MNNFADPQVQKTSITSSFDPQKKASDPHLNVWVAASAGTGKTKVLVDRVLRLMLPRKGEGLESAVSPDKILCITFTKAAAAEMKERIAAELRRWLKLSDAALSDVLTHLCEGEIDDDILKAGRQLFAKVIDLPSPMKIMTIHSFCQSILKRFPLEAGVSPHFELIDEAMIDAIMTECLQRLEREIAGDLSHPLATALVELKKILSSQEALIKDVLALKNKPEAFLASEAYDIYGAHGLTPEITFEDISASFHAANDIREKRIKSIALLMMEDASLAQQQKARALFDYYGATSRSDFYQAYKKFFLTDKDKPRKHLASKEILKQDTDADVFLKKEQDRVLAFEEQKKALALCQITGHFSHVALDLLARYQAYKKEKSLLDYDDLIQKTATLLSNRENTAWVLFKLDQGIDHILVDEAQDTNYAQWAIVKAICDDFFAGETVAQSRLKPQKRSLFVVGDEKQSIYSFHGADVTAFETMRQYFTEKIQAAECAFEKINLQKSFRSTASVLKAVDAVFAQPHVRQGIVSRMEDDITHYVSRIHDEGIAELWPVFDSDAKSTDVVIGQTDQITKTGDFKLAEYIADKIQTWLLNGEKLVSHNRNIAADDILILVRSRGRFAKHMMRALKARSIPVAGMDRIYLQQEIIVEDMMVAAKAALYPYDDLILASFLKTPFMGCDEDKVMALCLGRGRMPLFEYLKQAEPKIYDIIADLSAKAKVFAPFDFLNFLLQAVFNDQHITGQASLLRRFGIDSLDAVDELLNLSLSFEKVKMPTLEMFCHWFYRSEIDIKREQENGHNTGVRLMTVHGSKGLQAPIVFLPDCLTSAKGEGRNRHIRMIIPKSPIDEPFLYAPDANYKTAIFNQYESVLLKESLYEHQRLLYVAMTRAADRLYIGGYKKAVKKKKDETSDDAEAKPSKDLWHDWIHSAFQEKAERFLFDEIKEGGTRYGYRFYNPQTKMSTKTITDKSFLTQVPKCPDFFAKNARPEKPYAKPLAPSHLQLEGEVFSPLESADQMQRFKRGVIAHTLLQVLPDIAPADRYETMMAYLSLPYHLLSADEKDDLAREIMKVLDHPDFKMLFSHEAKAEVPVTGLIKGGGDRFALSGQIDRLLVTKDKVLIVDFKTNRPPARSLKDVPLIYLRQLASYRALLKEIYPDKSIECALLWTYIPLLMPIPSERLDLALE